MANNSSVNLDINNNSDGFDIGGGTTKRKFSLSGGDVSVSGSSGASGNTHTYPDYTSTLVGVTGSPSLYDTLIYGGSQWEAGMGLSSHMPSNLLSNGHFMNCSTNGYGGMPERWGYKSGSASGLVQGGVRDYDLNDVAQAINTTTTPFRIVLKLDEDSGNAIDLSSNEYDLTDNNTVGSSTDGILSKGRDFVSANSEYFSIADASAPNLEDTSGQSWLVAFRPDVVQECTLIGKYKNTNSGNGKRLQLLADGRVRFTLGGIATNTSVTSDVRCEAGKWYFVMGAYDTTAGELSITVNGIRKSVPASGSTGDSNADFTVGCDLSGASDTAANFFDGIMNSVIMHFNPLEQWEYMSLWEFLGGLSGVKLVRNGTDVGIEQTVKRESLGMQENNAVLRCYLKAFYTTNVTGGVVELDYGGTVSKLPLSSTGGLYSTLLNIDAVAYTPTKEVKVSINLDDTDGYLIVKCLGLVYGKTGNYYGNTPAVQDWVEFPGLMRGRPPAVTNGYSFEERKWYTWGSGNASATGFSSSTADIKYMVNGEMAAVYTSLSGTSNATDMAFRSPVIASKDVEAYTKIEDNGSVGTAVGLAYTHTSNPTSLVFKKDLSGAAFTSSGAKGVTGLIMQVPIENS